MDLVDHSELIELVDPLAYGRSVIVTLSVSEDHQLHVNLVGCQGKKDFDHAHPAIDLSISHVNRNACNKENVTIKLLCRLFVNRSAMVEIFSFNVGNTK